MVRVISLGGSVIIPDKVSYEFLMKFKKLILKHSKKEKLVIVCGGGSVARTYIEPLRKAGTDLKLQGLIGIRVTRLNAWLLLDLFHKKCAPTVAKSLKSVRSFLKRYKIVFAGGLSYDVESSSDASAVKIADMLGTDFINITDTKGIYNKNPKFKDAKFMPCLSFDALYKLVAKEGFVPGKHGILDLHSVKLIKKHKITTYVVSENLSNLKKLLDGKKFVGTVIGGR